MKVLKMKKGQAGIREIPSSALYIGIAIFVVALIITILGGLATSICTQDGGTEGTYINATTVNPVTNTYIGCCLTLGTNGTAGYTQAANCTSWSSQSALNATEEGITGLGTFNDFWAVLVLIVILAIVITALYAVFPRRAGI